MKKGTASGILAGKAYRVAVTQQCAVSDDFGKTPVYRIGAGSHLAAVFEDLRHPRVELEPFGDAAGFFRYLTYDLCWHRGRDGKVPRHISIRSPIDGVLVVGAGKDMTRHHLTAIECITIFADHVVGLLFREYAVGNESIGIKLARRWVCLDLLIHHRLGNRRFVGFVVTMPAITH